VGIGEGDDLPGIGGVRHDLLVAAEGGVEHDLAPADTCCTDRLALEDAAVRQHQGGGPNGHGFGCDARIDGDS